MGIKVLCELQRAEGKDLKLLSGCAPSRERAEVKFHRLLCLALAQSAATLQETKGQMTMGFLCPSANGGPSWEKI